MLPLSRCALPWGPPWFSQKLLGEQATVKRAGNRRARPSFHGIVGSGLGDLFDPMGLCDATSAFFFHAMYHRVRPPGGTKPEDLNRSAYK